MPIDIEVRFDNGERVRERWDGQARWKRFAYLKNAKAVSAEIDPDHTVQLDRNNFNGSFRVEGSGRSTFKLSNYWQFVTQLLSQALTWWAV